MLYMIIERFHPGKAKEIYQELDKAGRKIPEGVHYINSWIDEDLTTCYQVMESDSDEKMQEWVNMNKGPVDYEVIKVITSAQAKEKALRS
ncbi:DUF3303 domain-containing protein [Sporocytophaga myxococcoides]|uniref:DUF3303 domain-containing protein n=1 Tax=Sporocytophaga myxococcoides TaxID=153721 RepID=UPI0003FB9738|nr:DUF3303 family protein [Sporocytophaga myxococcoides]